MLSMAMPIIQGECRITVLTVDSISRLLSNPSMGNGRIYLDHKIIYHVGLKLKNPLCILINFVTPRFFFRFKTRKICIVKKAVIP